VFELVLVLVAKMHSPVTYGADYLRHFFSTSHLLIDIYELAFFRWNELLPFLGAKT
jgi:hypothetical protein